MDEIKGKQPPKIPQPSPQIQTEEAIHEEHKKSTATLVAVGILAVLIIIVGFYALKVLKKPEIVSKPTTEKTSETTAPSPVTTEVTTPEPSETAEKSPATGVTVQASVKDPDVVVEEFYNWYTNYAGDPIADGAYKTQEAVSDELAKKIESAEKETDPFLCSDEKSSDFEVEPADTSGDSSTVAVNVQKDGTIIPVKINLKLNGAWKMINVTCLSENGERSILENLKQETGLDYTTVIDTIFYWNVPDYKGRKAITVNGKGFSTANAALDSSVIKNFFTKNGFKSDASNASGYKKDDIVCIDSSKTDSANKYNVKVDCGKLSVNS